MKSVLVFTNDDGCLAFRVGDEFINLTVAETWQLLHGNYVVEVTDHGHSWLDQYGNPAKIPTID